MDHGDKYLCPMCHYILRDAVQTTSCGHWLCAGCAEQLFKGKSGSTPICPRPECGEELTNEDRNFVFPDRFVRKEIGRLKATCVNRKFGCQWTGTTAELRDSHLKVCVQNFSASQGAASFADESFEEANLTPSAECLRFDCSQEVTTCTEDGQALCPGELVCKEREPFLVNCQNEKFGCDWIGFRCRHGSHLCERMKTECPYCKEAVTPAEYTGHTTSCAKAPVQCPLKDYGCGIKEEMTRDQCVEHLTTKEGLYQHILFLASFLSTLQFPDNSGTNDSGNVEEDGSMMDINGAGGDEVVQLGPLSSSSLNASTCNLPPTALVPSSNFGASGFNPSSVIQSTKYRDLRQSMSTVMPKFTELRSQLSQKDSIIHMLQDKVKQLEVNQQSKSSENEDHNFRLSLMEDSTFDDTFLWKIPQFSQRMDDAITGKYTSIFSLPFYTNHHGYKMRLRLYINGDGIGKGSHMSLFFVVMKGEFDNILQWPFTHKVTFKLINQWGERDIIDTFKPDPLSSSVQKPKSDMNVASGRPRFVSLTELMNGDYIVDDTVFIKVVVDTSTMPGALHQ